MQEQPPDADVVETLLPPHGLLVSDFTRRVTGSTVDIILREPFVEDGRQYFRIVLAVSGAPSAEAKGLAYGLESRYGRPVRWGVGPSPAEFLLETEIPPESIPSPALRFLLRFLPVVPRRSDSAAPRIFIRSKGGDYRLIARRQAVADAEEAIARFQAFAAKLGPEASIRMRPSAPAEVERYRSILAAGAAV